MRQSVPSALKLEVHGQTHGPEQTEDAPEGPLISALMVPKDALSTLGTDKHLTVKPAPKVRPTETVLTLLETCENREP